MAGTLQSSQGAALHSNSGVAVSEPASAIEASNDAKYVFKSMQRQIKNMVHNGLKK